jgi:hypothetical protein
MKLNNRLCETEIFEKIETNKQSFTLASLCLGVSAQLGSAGPRKLKQLVSPEKMGLQRTESQSLHRKWGVILHKSLTKERDSHEQDKLCE